MFTRLLDLGFKRSAAQALGFYLVCLLLGAFISGVAAPLAAALSIADSGFSSGVKVGAAVIIPFCIAMAIGIGLKKGIAL